MSSIEQYRCTYEYQALQWTELLVLEIMMGVQALKFCQNDAAQKALADTGESPLLYTQIPKRGEAKNDKLLDDIAAQIFRGSDGSSRFGAFGKPLRKNWGSLLHPDDAFWGVDPILDPKGETGNHLWVYLGSSCQIVTKTFALVGN